MPGSIAPVLSRTRACRGALLAVLFVCLTPTAALASAVKVVSFHGYRVIVPRGWPVYDLSKNPAVCVRFNRHAVYLGTPSGAQRCPAHAAGRTEAILLQPISAGAANAGGSSRLGAAPLLGAPGGSASALVNRAHGIWVTATWGSAANVIRRALGVGTLTAPTPAISSNEGAHPTTPPRNSARIASGAPPAPGGIYTGLGFDVCSTPSAAHMAAWGASPYRAVGVYIGGANMACSQPNLTAGWVSQESVAGWHLFPIYVGLQAPSNSCGCAAISRTGASSQGTAAAGDAVKRAQALGLGAGNPIYYDMEAYSRGSSNSPAVLAFLAAWTAGLHAQGYKSGVYSGDYSGISDLVSRYGTGYSEPDEIWAANWNGARTTSDGSVPSGEWALHQRLHQYQGGHNETHGGVTINIDGDYLDAATGAAGSATGSAGEWLASSAPTISGQPIIGQTLVEGHGSWPGGATAYAYQWEDCNSSGAACTPISGATGPTYTPAGSDLGHRLRVLETASNVTATSVPASSSATGQVANTMPFYWLYTPHGNVNQSFGTAWYGSPIGSRYRGSSISGMAATADGKGYWLVTGAGAVYAYGDAAHLPVPRHAHPVKGIVAAAGGGYWLYTAYGNVYGTGGTGWYGSPAGSRYRGSPIIGMAATADGRGYWLATSAGAVYAYGDAKHLPAPRHVGRSGGSWPRPVGGTGSTAPTATSTAAPGPGGTARP